MKNIHVILTDKPSRFLYNSTLKSFCIQKEINGMFINDGKVSGADFWGLEKALNNGFQPHNIYITSDEEIKEGDWHFKNDKMVTKSHLIDNTCKKIILTTDGDLIKAGVQAIDDGFLGWFVNNPSCEEVEVELVALNEYDSEISVNSYGFEKFGYKLIIPKETYMFLPKEEHKQETLEEAAVKYSEGWGENDDTKSFIQGAKWQQKRMYDLMNQYADDVMGGCILRAEEWFKQFKKK